ncbi:TPA: hypothetical protein N0F65_012228 [Lagenidium giganteum]|uniref:Uncharacterized protein n=1 Tax=Lagenidium giganteum TaxID=4803 RepID=A0AAV2ZFN4_9STRA|nr:TPA: hypothetical protein N0F65_012228 [Lagenidium giganteum]
MGQFSSLVLQVALGCHHAYLHVYFIVTLGLFIYKGIVLPYPPTGAYTWDIIFLFLYLFIEKTRMFHASKGNRTKLLAPLVLSLVLTVPTTICTAYYLQLQTYVCVWLSALECCDRLTH